MTAHMQGELFFWAAIAFMVSLISVTLLLHSTRMLDSPITKALQCVLASSGTIMSIQIIYWLIQFHDWVNS